MPLRGGKPLGGSWKTSGNSSNKDSKQLELSEGEEGKG